MPHSPRIHSHVHTHTPQGGWAHISHPVTSDGFCPALSSSCLLQRKTLHSAAGTGFLSENSPTPKPQGLWLACPRDSITCPVCSVVVPRVRAGAPEHISLLCLPDPLGCQLQRAQTSGVWFTEPPAALLRCFSHRGEMLNKVRKGCCEVPQVLVQRRPSLSAQPQNGQHQESCHRRGTGEVLREGRHGAAWVTVASSLVRVLMGEGPRPRSWSGYSYADEQEDEEGSSWWRGPRAEAGREALQRAQGGCSLGEGCPVPSVSMWARSLGPP